MSRRRNIGRQRLTCPAVCGVAPAGFTLIELLVALVMVGTLAGGVSLAFRTSLDAEERLRTDASRSRELQLVLSVIGSDIEHAVLDPRSERYWFVGTDERDGDRDADTLRLVTRSHRVPIRDLDPAADWESQARHADWSSVAYSIGTSADGGTGLLRREQVPPGLDITDELSEEELLSAQVTELNLRYFNGTDWLESWDAAEQNPGELPRAVEVTVGLSEDSGTGGSGRATALFLIRMQSAAVVGEVAAPPAIPGLGGATGARTRRAGRR